MWEELKKLYPEGTANRTDPIVRHETKYSGSPIVMVAQSQYASEGEAKSIPGMEADPILVDGIKYPLIKMNNHVLLEHQLIKFVLHNDKFMPYIDLVFNDTYRTVEFADMPGLNNVVSVVILENIPDAHRPIKMDFYITSCKIIDDTFYVQAEFKCLPLEKQQFKQDVFYWPKGGCQGKQCGLGPNFSPTTYEFLHVIADQCGLGFSATQQTKEIKDDRYRILKREKYKEAAQKATSCGGLDENSIFDSWIDPWGTLVMANISWLMQEQVTPDELAIQATVGLDVTNGSSKTARQKTDFVHRILSNITGVSGMTNMMITEMHKMVDLDSAFYQGTLTDYHTVYPVGINSPGSEQDTSDKVIVTTQQIQETEASLPGLKTDEYEFHAHKFAGVEMSELTPTIEQRQRHNEYIKKLRSTRYCVTMLQPNFGLERGMLCTVAWVVDSFFQKGTVMQNRNNLSEDADNSTEYSSDVDVKGILNEKVSALDTSASGIYYIDGTDFEWSDDTETIVQHLYLIKKENLTQYYNKEVPVKDGNPR